MGGAQAGVGVTRPDLQPFIEPLLALADLLGETHLKGMVIGGVAAGLLGRPRFTADVDAMILIEPEQIGPFFQACARAGFSSRISGAEDFARDHRVVLLRHDTSGIPVNISLGALPFEIEQMERSLTFEIEGRSIHYPTPEDFIISKAVAHRPRDLEDIRSVIACHRWLDVKRIEHWVMQFARALAAPELWEDLALMLETAQRKKQ
jgi:hypothetical protein